MRPESEVAKEIAASEETLAGLKGKLADLKEPILSAYAEALQAWYEPYARQTVISEDAVTESLDAAAMASLKSEVAELSGQARQLVDREVGDLSRWWHEDNSRQSFRFHGTGGGSQYAPSHGTVPTADAFRRAMGELARVLEPRGYLKRHSWRDFIGAKTDVFQTPREVEVNLSSVHPRLNDYAIVHSEALDEVDRLKDLQQELRKIQASDAWDSA